MITNAFSGITNKQAVKFSGIYKVTVKYPDGTQPNLVKARRLAEDFGRYKCAQDKLYGRENTFCGVYPLNAQDVLDMAFKATNAPSEQNVELAPDNYPQGIVPLFLVLNDELGQDATKVCNNARGDGLRTVNPFNLYREVETSESVDAQGGKGWVREASLVVPQPNDARSNAADFKFKTDMSPVNIPKDFV